MPSGVTATINGRNVEVKGPKGQMSFVLNSLVLAEMTDEGIKVDPSVDSKPARAMWGMSRTMIANLITGVSDGFEKKLEITGVGYRAQVQGKNLQLALGFSHDVVYAVPEGIEVKCPKPTEVIVSGMDKQRVGQVAAEIRAYRPPEPYKGKGIRYADEFIVRKEGKKK
ncbi:50S ribosomal protein L6 [Stappia taiwanensis]|nr:50S ribosomal protein L6 [Stappia taiwanensis]